MNIKGSLFLFVFLISLGLNAQNWEKMIEKADEDYAKGEYESALNELEKLKKKALKKLGPDNPYMPAYFVRKAKFNLATGILVGYEDQMQEALDISLKAHGPNSIEHAKNKIEVANMLMLFGDFIGARKHLEETKKMLEEAGNINDDIKARIDLDLAEVLSGQGYFKDALELINTHEQFLVGRAVDKETYIDDSGKIKSRKLEDEEVLERYHLYATLLTLRANTYRFMGDFHSADSAFIKAEIWINDKMGKESLEYVLNQYYNAQLFVENGMQELPKEVSYDKLLSYLKRKHNESHYLAFELYEGQLKEYLRNDQTSKFNNLSIEYDRAIKRNFPKTSIHRIILETVDFEKSLDREKHEDVYAEANEVLTQAKSLPSNHPRTAKLYEYLFQASLGKKDYQSAERAIQRSLEIKKNLYGENSPQYHLVKVLYANYLLEFTEKIDEAGEIYNESFLKVIKPQVNFRHKDYLDILNHLASYYEQTDQYKKASETLIEASEAAIQKYQDDDYAYGIALENIADLRIDMGLYDEATKDIDKALSILLEYDKEPEIAPSIASALETNARLLAVKGYFDEAEDNLERSKGFIKKAETVTASDLEAREELAALFITLGKFSDARENLQEVLAEYEKLYGPTSRKLVNPLTYLGRIELISGDYPEAEKFAQRARKVGEKQFGTQSTKLAPTLGLLTDIYIALGDYDKAEVFVKDEIKILENQFGKNHIDVANAMAQLGLLKFYRGDKMTETERIMVEARDIVKTKLGDRNPIYADLLTDLAKIFISQKRFDEAFTALGIAELVWKAKTGKRNNINLASIFVLNGDIYYQQKKYDQAEDYYERARKLYNRFFEENLDYVKVTSKLAKLYYMEGDYRKAKASIEESLENYAEFIDDYFPALSEREKAKFWNTIKPDYEFYNTLAFNLRDEFKGMVGNVYNNALLTKALLLNSAIKTREAILSSGDQELRDIFLDWLKKKEDITNILSMSTEQLQENNIDPVSLQQDVEQLEKELSLRSELFSTSFDEQTINWEQVKNSLKPNEVAVEMVRYRYFDHSFTDSVVYAVMYISGADKKATPEVVLLDNGQDLEQKYFKYYRNSIIYQIEDPYSYNEYWKRIEDKIGSYSTIYLSADGVYNQINLEAIPLDDSKYVIDNSNIILVSNTKDIYKNKVTSKPARKDNKALMFGNPDFYLTASASNKINPLPGTEKEILTLNEILSGQGWKTNFYMNENASEERLKSLKSPKIFHVATHGFYSEQLNTKNEEEIVLEEMAAADNPLLRTGLLLSGAGDLLDKTSFNYNLENGILTAYEAMNLSLDDTELVVLSACETGLGDLAVGEGVYGLQRAFLVAGAKTLIMSMFKVNDQATQELMSSFYKKWLATGNKRQSFIEAKKELRNKYHDPIYWGAFIMIGLE